MWITYHGYGIDNFFFFFLNTLGLLLHKDPAHPRPFTSPQDKAKAKATQQCCRGPRPFPAAPDSSRRRRRTQPLGPSALPNPPLPVRAAHGLLGVGVSLGGGWQGQEEAGSLSSTPTPRPCSPSLSPAGPGRGSPSSAHGSWEPRSIEAHRGGKPQQESPRSSGAPGARKS